MAELGSRPAMELGIARLQAERLAVAEHSFENCRLVSRLARPNELARTPSISGSRGKSTNEHRPATAILPYAPGGRTLFSGQRPMRRCGQFTIVCRRLRRHIGAHRR